MQIRITKLTDANKIWLTIIGKPHLNAIFLGEIINEFKEDGITSFIIDLKENNLDLNNSLLKINNKIPN